MANETNRPGRREKLSRRAREILETLRARGIHGRDDPRRARLAASDGMGR